MIDAGSRKVIKTLDAGDEPHGVLVDRQGKYLYVANTSSQDISVFDVASLGYVKTLSASRGPWSMALSADGTTLLVTNMLARISPLRAPFVSEVSAIDTGLASVDDRRVVDGANLMMGVDWHPSGRFALATLNRTKSLVPMTRLIQGWTITNGLAVIWKDGRVDQVLLDEPDMGFADASDVACTPDGRYALVTSAGTDRVAVVDIARLTAILRRATPYRTRARHPESPGLPDRIRRQAYCDRRTARAGCWWMPDKQVRLRGERARRFAERHRPCTNRSRERIDLGGPKRDHETHGWASACSTTPRSRFTDQFACASCHPDGHVDGLTYDIEADGLGVSPVDNRTLRGILDTAPFKWEGTNPSLARQCGARLSVYLHAPRALHT